jgi:lysophospholipid acyltransferase (LPLAT)-like uncharacterized protein
VYVTETKKNKIKIIRNFVRTMATGDDVMLMGDAPAGKQ